MKKVSPLIEAEEFAKILNDEKLVVVDASFGKDAKANYEKKHIHNALFVDLNQQLADIKENVAFGGRHPLPSTEMFSKVLTSVGIQKDSHVVAYDWTNGSLAAARFWWMLRSVGHENVQVLNGGFGAAENVGVPVDDNEVTPREVDLYKTENWILPQADISEVENVTQNKNYLVIDVREKDRYNGVVEPIDLIAGHIPGAVNVPFTTNLRENGHFLSKEELCAKYESLLEGTSTNNVIVHCGSGVTACHTLLAMDYAGLEIPKLYVGSWSEWSRNDKPMVTISKDK